jgi:hypothetical protein
MIKFFRHIRQKLLMKSKFSKYLLYAVGEIILVVIGILIAQRTPNAFLSSFLLVGCREGIPTLQLY